MSHEQPIIIIIVIKIEHKTKSFSKINAIAFVFTSVMNDKFIVLSTETKGCQNVIPVEIKLASGF